MPLDRAGDRWLSVGGEVREQYELYVHPDFGRSPEDRDGFLLQRYLLHGDLHLGRPVRVFGQLVSALASFQRGPPGPADEDRLDLHQAFLDLRAEPPGGSLTLRVGRQEMLYGSQRLVSVREGPNVRRAFDAVRLLTTLHQWRIDGFLSRPVDTRPGVFDDRGADRTELWGVYGTGPVGAGAELDLYYLGLDRPDATFAQGTAHELRHSLGLRVSGEAGGLDYDLEAVVQWGRFGRGDIRAWTVASDTGYALARVPLAPRLGLRADVTSGDRDRTDRDLGTFNPLFPRGNYFGESAILGPANLVDLHPMVQLHPAEPVAIELAWTSSWRASAADALYGPSLGVVLDAPGSDRRYVGGEASVLVEWSIARQVGVASCWSHFFAGPFPRRAGPGEDIDYFTVLGTYRF